MSSQLYLLLENHFTSLSTSLQKKVYLEYHHMMYGLIVYMIKDPIAAEDIIQESFIKIINNKPEFECEAKLKAWLKVVTRNTAINYLRKHKYCCSMDHESAVSSVEAYSQVQPSVEDLVETKMLQEAIEYYLTLIKPDYKVLIELRWKRGLSYREIAEITGTREETVKQRLYRARESIRRWICKDWRPDESAKPTPAVIQSRRYRKVPVHS
ncbi:sigma-70 family RNA polymerase sigma factor [Paenibacillus sp. JX-17]|uniref:RNA polymerase sigma factor n=1 Tax=Paenibacillus lacisoli TaxID=3064525 RepID=A0ABT9C6I9_9BACL|nr:sigma-70 family RNA polymerase sigma factor [Paenibacillus sp. JX-17]MDO7904861.1 sigma-70 family RNA polymerase sigma factor [Paenibacillus sp. JX-17]